MRLPAQTERAARARLPRARRASAAAAAAAPLAVPDLHDGLQALSEGALHITVYDLLAHAYNRVAIQYYHDQGAALLLDRRRYPPTIFAPALPPTLQREVVAALLADSARALATFFGFEEMNFLLLDHDQEVYRLVVREGAFFPKFQQGAYAQPFGTGLLGQCHLERRTVLANDVSQVERYVRTDPAVRAELCVPVVLGDELLAIIDTGASQINAFAPAHAAFIEGFARYLAPAIADPLAFLQAWRPGLVRGDSALAPLAQALNFLYAWHEEWRSRFALLYTEVAQRNAELLALIDLSESLSTSLRLDTILNTTVAKVAQLLSCQLSWILLPDEDDRLRIRALYGGSAGGLAEAGIAADGSPQFSVFASGEPVITNDLARVTRSSFDWAFCRRNEITRYATVPLRVRERTIGVMNVGRTHAAEDLTEQDVRLLATFASQIALAIENADLYERSRLLGALEERERLGRDLHDTLAQSVVGILRALEGAEIRVDAGPEALRMAITQARTQAQQSLEEARRSVWNLQPAELDRQSLWEALKGHVHGWGVRTGVEARCELAGERVALAPQVEANVLHTAQEALNNVVRHAHATHVAVSLQHGPAGLRLAVTDNGVGFDAAGLDRPPVRTDDSRYAPAGGLGLRGMRERARLLGGWLQVESAPGWGTRVVLTLPPDALGVSADDPEQAGRTLASLQQIGLGSSTHGAPACAPQPGDEHAPALGAGAAPTIGVLLADDHPAVRDGLRLALSQSARIRVVGMAASGREALELAHALRPDVLLLDLQMPEGDGLAVLRGLRERGLPVRAIVLTAYASDASIAEALEAGAVGFLQKDIKTPQLVEAIHVAAQGRPVFSPEVAERLRGRVGLLVNLRAGRLTAREREVLKLLATGMRRSAIAQRLCVSEATIKFHMLNLYQKLQSSSRVEALNRAREWGLLS